MLAKIVDCTVCFIAFPSVIGVNPPVSRLSRDRAGVRPLTSRLLLMH